MNARFSKPVREAYLRRRRLFGEANGLSAPETTRRFVEALKGDAGSPCRATLFLWLRAAKGGGAIQDERVECIWLRRRIARHCVRMGLRKLAVVESTVAAILGLGRRRPFKRSKNPAHGAAGNEHPRGAGGREAALDGDAIDRGRGKDK